jgi:protein-L-isoaspartate(D-aspartate) O-methyltransferase
MSTSGADVPAKKNVVVSARACSVRLSEAVMTRGAVVQIQDVDKATELAIVRRAYAKQLLALVGVTDPWIEAAFTEVPRERYLGMGPWLSFNGIGTYVATPTDDPIYVYTDRLFGLIPGKSLNNGQPSLHVALMAAAGVTPGQHVVHVGAGTGYYSAILAHIVGPTGRVTAIEFDAGLASRATMNLSGFANVRVIAGDAFTASFEPVDVIYMNASTSRIPTAWLDRLREGGNVILPMGTRAAFKSIEPGAMDLVRLARMAGQNVVFRIARRGDEFHVRTTVPGGFIPAEGGDDAADAALAAALGKGGAKNVTRLYRTDDIPEARCWLKGEGWCLAYS